MDALVSGVCLRADDDSLESPFMLGDQLVQRHGAYELFNE